jgi:prolipoprotein diacylglyceryltransferase
MSGAAVHVGFDIAAWCAAAAATLWLTHARRIAFPAQTATAGYLATLTFGAGIGAYLFGSLNLWLSGLPGVARSIEGALAGGIVAIELYKALNGISLRTGARFALPLALGIAVGRLGCFGAGMDDFTYGTPTALPWGHDFGDGIPRHPVQLYESLAMAVFAVAYVAGVLRGRAAIVRDGFYLALAFYGAQRFVWEFFKPYAPLLGPLTLFHLLSLAILAYAAAMLASAPPSPVEPVPAHDRSAA